MKHNTVDAMVVVMMVVKMMMMMMMIMTKMTVGRMAKEKKGNMKLF